jgi:hypothetical protein
MRQFLQNRLLLIVFLIGYFTFSFLTFRHYGNTWDEHDVYSRGQLLYEHYQGKDNGNILLERQKGIDPGNVIYNHSYGALAYSVNKGFSFENFHLFNLLFGSLIFIAIYELLLYFYKDQRYAVIGPVFLALTPRFFGDIPTNPKDMPFAVMFMLSLAGIFFLSKSQRFWFKTIVLGLLIGITQSFRILGISFYFILFLYKRSS